MLAEVSPLSVWNTDFYGQDVERPQPALRYVINEGQSPLAAGTGLYVHNPPESGAAFYAVTLVVDGRENVVLTDDNRTTKPTSETPGAGQPVLQRIEKPREFAYVEGPTLEFYVRWENPPNANVENRPIDYLVALPRNMKRPAPVGIHLHEWGGNLTRGYGWWFNAAQGAVLVASNQVPYDWWTGYHERFGVAERTQAAWSSGVVRPYTQRRLLSFVRWLNTKYAVDSTRIFAAGNSMGGSGSLMLAIRFPEVFAWAVSWVGVHDPAGTPTFRNSYAHVFGPPEWNVKFEDGHTGLAIL